MFMPVMSRDLCTAFSNKMKRYFEKNPTEKMFTLSGSDVESYKYLFDWMQNCVDCSKVQKLDDPEMRGGDEPFLKLANILDAIAFLDIGQLHTQAIKRVLQLAQKHVMTISEIDHYLTKYGDTGVGRVNEEGEPIPAMMNIPVESVGYGFHARTFDHDEEYVEQIGVLRQFNDLFDTMLEEKIMAVPSEIAAAKQAGRERKARIEAEKKEAEGGSGDYGGEGGAGEGWGNDDNNATTAAVGSWDSAPAPAVHNNDWDTSNDNAATQHGSSDEVDGSGQWGDEMNEVAAAAPHAAPSDW